MFRCFAVFRIHRYSEEQSWYKSDSEERNQPTTESNLKNPGRKKDPQNAKETDTYLPPLSKKMKFKVKMKKKENAKVETSKNTNKSKKEIDPKTLAVLLTV